MVAMLVLATGISPAAAAKKKDGGSSPVSRQDMLGDNHTTDLDEVRAGIGADMVLNTYGLSGGGLGVAVIDTGVNQTAGLTGNSKVIDGPDLSFDALEDNLRHRDLHGHGTNMAAIIAADNSTAGDGVAHGAHIVNVKVGAADGAVDVSQVIAAIDWVVANRDLNANNIRVINLAFSTDATQDYLLDPLSHAVENAWRAGIVVVVAGGNDGRGIHQLGNPAINPYVIAVGATQADGSEWNVPSWTSSGYGVRNPDLVAPGSDIVAAGIGGFYPADTYRAAVCEARNTPGSARSSEGLDLHLGMIS